MPNLKSVFYAAGNVKAFAEPLIQRDIILVSAWDINAIPVAEMCLSQILLSLRGYFRATRRYRSLKSGEAKSFARSGVFGETVGLIGLGKIGVRLRRLLAGFPIKVIAYDPFLSPERAEELDIELVDRGTVAGALGMCAGHRAPERPVRTEGGVMYFSTPAGAIGFHGRFFFRIAGNSSNAAIQAKAGQVVRGFAALPVKERETPLPFRMFTEAMGIDPTRVSFQQNNVFQYDFAKNFWFAQPHPKRPMRFFVHPAETPAAAAKLFQAIPLAHGE